MLILTNATTDSLKVITASAVANADMSASFVDYNGSTVTPGNAVAQIATATTTTLVGTPGASTQRNVKHVHIRNSHATSSNLVTVELTINGTTVTLIAYTLLAGEALMYYEDDGWVVIDATGGLKTAASQGRLLKVSLVSAGTTFTSQMGTTSLLVRAVGAGGGGGGCTSVSAASGGAGGGGAGGFVQKLYTGQKGNTTYAIAIGALGAGASGAAGGNGGDTTFTDGTTLITAKGGTGAVVCAPAATLTTFGGGAGGVVGTNGDINSGGDAGSPGYVVVAASTTMLVGGKGGSSQFGSGGASLNGAVGNGNAALGFGGGGGGAATGATTVRTGGSGTGGCLVIEEYA